MVYIGDSYHGRPAINDMAKLFWTGRSQAVRLPKEYRFEGKEVRIRRDEAGNVVLEPTAAEDNSAWANRIAGSWDEDAAATALDRPGPEALPDGPSFD